MPLVSLVTMPGSARLAALILVATSLASACGGARPDGDSGSAPDDGDAAGSGSATAPADPYSADPYSADPYSADPYRADPYSGELTIRVVATHPHDPTSWTQGLEWHDGLLLESTGRRGQSTLRLVEAGSGEVVSQTTVDDELYAEGVTVVDGRALQLTWTSETLLETDLSTLGQEAATTRRDGAYAGEGWGLCYDGTQLVMSNGSSALALRDPTTFELRREVEVTRDGAPLDQLNELECVAGQVWANVWQTNEIVAIDPATGQVSAVVDATELVPEGYEDALDEVLNGIAYHPERGTFWLTGKLWPVLYEVELSTDGT